MRMVTGRWKELKSLFKINWDSAFQTGKLITPEGLLQVPHKHSFGILV